MMMMWPDPRPANIPAGWKECVGQTLSYDTYPALAAVLRPLLGTATAASNVFTLASHSLATGDAVFLTTTVGSVTALNIVFAIYQSSSTFKLATSYNNAAAGTAITAASGTSAVYACPYEALYATVTVGAGSSFHLPDVENNMLAFRKNGATTADDFAATGRQAGSVLHQPAAHAVHNHAGSGNVGDTTLTTAQSALQNHQHGIGAQAPNTGGRSGSHTHTTGTHRHLASVDTVRAQASGSVGYSRYGTAASRQILTTEYITDFASAGTTDVETQDHSHAVVSHDHGAVTTYASNTATPHNHTASNVGNNASGDATTQHGNESYLPPFIVMGYLIIKT
jgi:hypothetical protein